MALQSGIIHPPIHPSIHPPQNQIKRKENAISQPNRPAAHAKQAKSKAKQTPILQTPGLFCVCVTEPKNTTTTITTNIVYLDSTRRVTWHPVLMYVSIHPSFDPSNPSHLITNQISSTQPMVPTTHLPFLACSVTVCLSNTQRP